MTIDIHAHVTADLERRLVDDARLGIDLTVLLSTRVHPERAGTLEEVKMEFAALQRVVAGTAVDPSAFTGPADELREALDVHAGRVVGMAAAPLALDEQILVGFVDEQLRHAAMVGIGELTPAPGAAQSILPVVRLADDHGGIPVLTHGFAPNTDTDLRVYADIARRHPRVPIIIGAFGGLNAMLAVELARDVGNLHLDLSSVLQAFVLKAAVQEIPHRCMFGSNTPYGVPAASLATLHSVIDDAQLLAAVLHDNAAKLWKIT
ncbi:amidohydrolase family protein [Krasilnikovia sp. MM14-A1259]|uniref:amidohydrolase family protein n=1 Tax=Krasilnikovia sp. MM14-A1259 TaxID=3373539 RepID=UPI0037F77C06